VRLFRRSRFTRLRDGSYRLRFDPQERALLATLPDQMTALLLSGETEAAAVRLFPPAYADDAAMDAEYQSLMREELVRRRLEAVETLRASADEEVLTEEQLSAWVRVLNDVRLVLGTVLDVNEEESVLDVEPDAPDTPQRVAYVVLSEIVDDAVGALTAGLPPPTQ